MEIVLAALAGYRVRRNYQNYRSIQEQSGLMARHTVNHVSLKSRRRQGKYAPYKSRII